MQKEVHGGQTPNILFFAKPAIENRNIQPGVFLTKIKGQQSVSFFVYCHLMNF